MKNLCMVNMKELEWAISELEGEESSFKNYSILADLYTVRANNAPKEPAIDTYAMPQAASYQAMEGPEVVGDYGGSDFLQIVRGRDAAAWRVVDVLMDTLKVVNRKVYDSVIRKLETV